MFSILMIQVIELNLNLTLIKTGKLKDYQSGRYFKHINVYSDQCFFNLTIILFVFNTCSKLLITVGSKI